MRIVFFGTPQFAVPTLERLVASPHQVVTAVTQPDRPRGRGQHVTEGPVKAAARAHGIPVLQPDRLKNREFLDALAALAPDLGVVAAYGKILPQDLLHIPRLGLINVHASLLPRWRGAAPIERAIMAGDGETGVTIMRIVAQLDAGAMLAAAPRPIDPNETAADVERDLAESGARLLLPVVDRLERGEATETPQDPALVTHAPRITKEEGLIDWSQPARAIHDRVRALHPWPHAFSYLRGQRYIILRTSPEASRIDGPTVEPGTVADAAGDRFLVATGLGGLRIHEIQPEGRRPIDARQFLIGYHVRPGDLFDSAGTR